MNPARAGRKLLHRHGERSASVNSGLPWSDLRLWTGWSYAQRRQCVRLRVVNCGRDIATSTRARVSGSSDGVGWGVMSPPSCYCPSDERARCDRAILSANTGTAPHSTWPAAHARHPLSNALRQRSEQNRWRLPPFARGKNGLLHQGQDCSVGLDRRSDKSRLFAVTLPP